MKRRLLTLSIRKDTIYPVLDFQLFWRVYSVFSLHEQSYSLKIIL